MLFSFLKYINPVWYYNIITNDGRAPYFVDYRLIDARYKAILDIDYNYRTREALLADAAYQAWQKGVIIRDPAVSLFTAEEISDNVAAEEFNICEGLSVKVRRAPLVSDVSDNYRFIRRFFNPVTTVYIFLLRIFSWHNPFAEIRGLTRSLRVKRVDLFTSTAFPVYEDDYRCFRSELLTRQPRVSVIIPTLNRYDTLKDVLQDLAAQDYKNFEVIVCDQSDEFRKDFYVGWNMELKIIRQDEKALWKARNALVCAAGGEYIAFSEDDVRVKPDWITEHLRCVDYFGADISAGVFFPEGSVMPEHRRHFRWAEQFAAGNALIRKEVFITTGLFDRQFEGQRGGDGEFGLRCRLLGFRSISNPRAFCVDIKAPTGGLREMGSWDSFRPTSLFSPRPVPSILYHSRKYFGEKLSGLLLLFTIPGSLVPYRLKTKRWAKGLSLFTFFFGWPVLLVQILISWHLAGKKVGEGAMIEMYAR